MVSFKDLLVSANHRVDDFHEMQKLGLHCNHGDFIPAGHYPPITKYPPITQEEMFRGYVPPADGLMDVYIHIPFCPKRCIYCHYPSIYGGPDSEKDRYLDAMERNSTSTCVSLAWTKSNCAWRWWAGEPPPI